LASVTGIQRILIWSKWLRIAHWLIALPGLSLFASGWLIDKAPIIADATTDIHLLLAPLFTIGLLLRILLLFIDKENASLKALTPDPQWQKIGEMLRFYLSFGRMPLPRWYAHNPLWAPLYIFIIALLLLQAISGFVQSNVPILAGVYLPSLHGILANILFTIMLLHILAVVLHDLKGNSADISAMINGHKFFVPGESDNAVETTPGVQISDIGRENKHEQ
jgi:Ni/Fe-hydrogenase 1 B-type cytochrome subunit